MKVYSFTLLQLKVSSTLSTNVERIINPFNEIFKVSKITLDVCRQETIKKQRQQCLHIFSIHWVVIV